MKKRTMINAMAGVTMLALSLTACGGGAVGSLSGNGSSNGGNDANLTTIRVSGVPSENMSALNLGQKQGFFAEQGLRVETVPAQGGAAIINGVVQGSNEFGYATVPPLAIARAQGQEIVGVTGSGFIYPNVGITMVAVKDGSGINSLDDLKGKKVGVNQVKAFFDVCLSAYFMKKGEDPKAATPVELPFAQLAPSVSQGQLAASVLTEPFSTQARQAGLKDIGDVCGQGLPADTTVGMFFTSSTFKQQHPDVVEKFNAAMTKTIALLNENKAVFADQIAKDGQLSADERSKLQPRNQRATMPEGPMREYVQILADLGIIQSAQVDPVLKGLIGK